MTLRSMTLMALSALLLLAACEPQIPPRETVTHGRRLYRAGATEPFSGYVVGTSAEDYRRHQCRFKKHYSDGRLEGNTYFWYPDGKLESVEPYHDGHLNGIVTRYHPNGKVKCRLHLVNGERGGKNGEVFWLPNGRLETVSNLKDWLSSH